MYKKKYSFQVIFIGNVLHDKELFSCPIISRNEFHGTTMIVKSLFVLIVSLVIGYVLYKKQLINDNEIEQEIIASWSESIVLPKKQFRKLLVG